MLNIFFELGQIASLGALACGAFLCIRESEAFRLVSAYLQSARDQQHAPVQREPVKTMMPRINGV